MEDEKKMGEGNEELDITKKNKIAKRTIFVSICLVISCILNIHLIYLMLKSVNFSRDGLSIKSIQKMNMVKTFITDYYYKDINKEELVESCIKGMTKLMDDPYTEYLKKEDMEELKQNTSGSYKGIGISIKLGADNLISIVDVFENSPAKKAGIESGDKILKVNGKDFTDVKDKELVTNLINNKDEDVNIEILRSKTNEKMNFILRTEVIKLVNVESKVINDSIGYIKIKMFDEGVSKYFKEHLEKLRADGIKGLLIDLRNNPGGDYKEVVAIADVLLKKGDLIVYTEDKYKKQVKEYAKGEGIDLPIGVLVNNYSASASEVLSGALKDNNKAWLLGEKTYGKGLVQAVVGFKDGTGLKITTSRYFIPSGKCIQGEGLEPDYKVELPDKNLDILLSEENDIQLKKALEIIKTETV